MKHIIISADGDSMVYLVPDEVADQLDKYCLSFCDTWLHTSPDAEPYRTGSIVSYDEKDFIKYLNTWVFPKQPSVKSVYLKVNNLTNEGYENMYYKYDGKGAKPQPGRSFMLGFRYGF